MGVGIGGLITGLMQGDPNQQIANALAGPNPNPQAAVGGAPSPSGAPGQAPSAPGASVPPNQPNMAPAPGYAPDPANASTIALLLRAHQQDLTSADINRNVQLMASGFGTAQQQHDKMALVNSAGAGGGDTLGALGEITKLQGEQMDLQNKQRFQASADLLGQTFGLKPGQGGMLSSDPELFNTVISRKVADQSPTELQKNITAYREQARAAGIPADQVESAVQMAFTGAINPGQTPDEKNMMRDLQLWRADPANQGKPLPPELSSVAGYAAAKAEGVKTSIAAGKMRLDNQAGLPQMESAIKPITDNIAQMYGPDGHVLPSVISAIQTPDPPTQGSLGALAGLASRYGGGALTSTLDPTVLDQKNKLTQLQQQLSSDAMKGQKNIRTQREFNTISGAASSIFNKTNTPQQIEQGLNELRDRIGLAHANALAAAGQEVPAQFAGKVDSDYFEKGNDLNNGATFHNDFRQLSGDDLNRAVHALPPGEVFVGPDGKPHTRK
jgi:hypothetical protein